MIPNMPFNDNCVISREGEENDWGVAEKIVLYNGKSNYQQGTSGSTSIQGAVFQTSPMVFLPEMLSELKQGDNVVITKRSGVVEKGIIEQWNPVDFEQEFGANYKGITYTEIWLIQNRT